MENSRTAEEMAAQMEDMRTEIAALRELLARENGDVGGGGHDIRSMLEDGFAKVSDAIRPLAKEANRRLGSPAKDVVAKVEEKIVLRPFAAVMIALGAGLVVGKMLDIAMRPIYVERRDS